MTLNEFLGYLEGVTGGDGQYSAKCPAHGDQHNSLSVSASKDGKILLHCHAGCTPEEIVEALGLTMKDLFAEVTPDEAFPAYKPPKEKARFEAEYIYPGGLKKVKMRQADGGKFCFWQHQDGDKWVKGRNGIEPGLYVTAPTLPGAVFLVEGEKDVETLKNLGKAAVSLPDGAKSEWRPEYGEALEGRKVVIIQDNDAPGKAAAQRWAGALHGVASKIQVLDLTQAWAELPEHGDTTDLIAQMGQMAGMTAILQLVKDTPEWKPPAQQTEEKRPPAVLEVISAVDLQEKDIPPIKFIVDNILPHGLNMLAAPSKYGKSWMVLDLCLAVADGALFLGHRTTKCGCLYLALEDSQRRLKGRMNKVLAGKKAPDGFYYATSAHDMDNGLFDELEGFLNAHPDTGLIVIDTLQKVRGATQGREGAYANDYREVGALKTFADQHGIALLLVHHLRKMRDDGDPFNMISGTNGIMGAADTTMVLTKEKRDDDNATLSIVGRDVESSDTVLRFNKETCLWENLGDADWVEEQRAKQEYQDSPIVKTIKKLVEQSPEGWQGTMRQLMDAGRFIARTYLAPSPRDLSSKLKALDKPLFDYDNIIHDRATHGNAGYKHRFYYAGMQLEGHPQEEINPFSGSE